jgi:hypothetical protein
METFMRAWTPRGRNEEGARLVVARGNFLFWVLTPIRAQKGKEAFFAIHPAVQLVQLFVSICYQATVALLIQPHIHTIFSIDDTIDSRARPDFIPGILTITK